MPRVAQIPGRVIDRNLASSLLTGLLAWWKLDEASGNTRVESVNTGGGNDSDAAEVGGTVNAVTGAINNGAEALAAGTPYLEVTSNAEIDVSGGDFTVHLLFRVNTTWNALDQDIITKGVGSSSNREWHILTQGTSLGAESIKLRVFNNNSEFANVLIPMPSGSKVDAFFQCILQLDNTTANAITGRINSTTAEGADNVSTGTSGTYTTDEGANLWFGRFGSGSGATIYLDEIGLWNRVLTSAEKTTLWNSGSFLSYPF